MFKGKKVKVNGNEFVCAGKWQKDWVFASTNPNSDEVLILTEGEINELAEEIA